MKFSFPLILLSLLILGACNASQETSTTKTSTAPSATATEALEEDCDDKAKKQVEITADSISLNGNTGCTLDEAQP